MNTPRRFLRLTPSQWLRWGTAGAVVAAVAALVIPLRAAIGDFDIAQEPLYSKQSQPPLMMMVMSRDEQLFNKAYSDYTDIGGGPDGSEDGILDTTYLDAFEYGGYFDSKLCYSVTGTGASALFKAAAKGGGNNGHSCTGQWSGNFLNWVTMSRLDVMRSVLYGGLRTTDSLTQTIIERARIPNDLHAWVKVYTGSDIGSFAPLTANSTGWSFCNGNTSATSGSLMRVASGNWSEWASTASYQCGVGRTDTDGKRDVPGSAADYAVRLDVCAGGTDALRENYCRKYTSGNTDRYKPAGLLQTYGESGRLRFGLISGTYANPRDGGVLRRNIGKLAGNGDSFCGTGDEIDLSTGQFCYMKSGATANGEGVINTISNFSIDQWNWKDNWTDCNQYGILNRVGTDKSKILNNPGSGNQKCSAWGNPLAEMYAEALRYVTGGSKVYSDSGDLPTLPTGIAWVDPYRDPARGGNSYCATCNILVMSSGLPSFDSDNIGTLPASINATTATNDIGTAEGIAGKSWMIGRVGTTPSGTVLNTHEDICQGRTVDNLSLARGICPDIPSMEGSYLVAGMAKAAAATDLRPGVQSKPASYKISATTYTVAMAENLPKFEIKVGGKTISLAPLCQANNDGWLEIKDAGWRSCFLGSVGVGVKSGVNNNKYGRPYANDASSGSFSLVWEDSLWGNDHDNDVVAMMSYCVGAACNTVPPGANDMCWRADPTRSVVANTTTTLCNRDQSSRGTTLRSTVAADEVLIRIENLSAFAGNAMLTGYTISGSNAADTVQRLTLRKGDYQRGTSGPARNGSVITQSDDFPSTWDRPVVIKYKASSGVAAGQLESPLWYAAKYGVPAGKKWDSKKPGVPDNYFLARNPSKLRQALDDIFASAAEGDAPVGGSGSGARITTGSFTVGSHYKVTAGSNDWTGDVVGTQVLPSGADGDELWRASSRMAGANRKIFMATSANMQDTKDVVTPVAAAAFTASAIPGSTRAQKLAVMGFSTTPTPIPAWFGSTTVDQLVNYLSGSAVPGLRTRTSPLGDIINSTTEIVSNRDDFGYGGWTAQSVAWKQTLGSAYKTFLNAKRAANGPPTMVYVGANDGMLHGFNASTTAAAGREEFAFIPSTSLQHIAELANPKYGHRYYVDGPVTSSDVYYGDSWHTVVAATTGAGGASKAPNAASVGNGSVFALDVSDPSGFDASKVLWEVSGKNESDLGFVLGKPAIVPLTSATSGGAPRFVALFGNGVNSSGGKAVLYVVDIQTGKVLKRLSPADSKYVGRNGLMNIVPVALKNADGVTDTVYGGDMKGNLWKFDLSSNDPANWNVAYSGAPLFTATRNNVAQPITGSIEVSSGPAGGISLFFGTGQYFAADDNTVNANTGVQTLYGVWDDLKTPIADRTSLVQQSVLVGTDSNGYETRDITSNPVSYTNKRGWYVDLTVDSIVDGERFIATPTIQSGRVFFLTYVPGSAICGSGGVNWRYGVYLLTGGGGMSGLSDKPGGDSICTGNCGGIKLTKGGKGSQGGPITNNSVFVPKLTPCDPSKTKCKVDELLEPCTYMLGTQGADGMYLPRPCGRQSWRQIR
ncbi:pilus assembly protein [Stenotrophomonas geniculata]